MLEIRTRRLGVLALSPLTLPIALLGSLLLAAALAGGKKSPEKIVLVLAGLSMLAVGLSGLVPIFRPRRLTFSSKGLRFRGLLQRRSWTWSQFVGIAGFSGDAKIYVEAWSGNAKPQRFFIGPFWPGGSKHLIELAERYRSELTPAPPPHTAPPPPHSIR